MKFKLLFLLLSATITKLTFSQNSSIRGKLIDETTGETLPGAIVMIQGTTIGTNTDFDGMFTLNNVAPGTCTLECKYVSYTNKIVKDIVVKSGEQTVVNISLSSASKELEVVEITSRKITNTETSVVNEIRKSDNVVSGISAAQIQKSQDRDASDVVKRIPGVTIIDNRFIMIRGLSDRYNTVWLNDASAPSSETDKKAFSFDVIPAGLIDRILIFKTPSADLPGDFAGGMVKIYTKSLPEKTSVSLDIKSSYRDGTTSQSFNYTQKSKTDWLGYDNGYRGLPKNLDPYVSKNSKTNSEQTKAFPNNWAMLNKNASPDLRVNFYYNQLLDRKNVKFGNTFGVNYTSTKTIFKIQRQDWDSIAQVTGYNDIQSTQAVRINALDNFAVLYKNHKIEFKNLFNQAGTDQATYRTSSLETTQNEKAYLFSYQDKRTYSSQLTGNHKTKNEKLSYDWAAGYGYINRNDPDLRRIKYTKEQTAADSMYKASVANIVDPVNGGGRFFSTLTEKVYSFNQNLKYKFKYQIFIKI